MRMIDADRMKEELLWGNVFLSAKETNAIVDLLDNQPPLTPPNEWVSVEERLPERGKDVLLYFEEESRISVGGRYDVGDGWYAVIVNEYETICDTSPRYWMPLPAPPEKEE